MRDRPERQARERDRPERETGQRERQAICLIFIHAFTQRRERDRQSS